MTTIVSIAQGGTGANNAAAARNTLGAAANTGGVFTGAINVATANITTIETGNTLTLSTGTASNGNIIFSANGAEDMRITTAGRVGIGTTIPPYILSAETGTATQLYLRGGSTGFTHASILLSSNTADSPQSRGLGTYMFNEGTDSTWYMGTFYNAGNTWGVGVAGGTTFQPQTADSANIRLSVANTGNVGISILSPTSNLHVVGNANVTTGINTATLNATTVNVTSTLGGGSTLTIQPNVTISQSLTVTGNLIVSGSSTTLNTEILIVEDADIVLLSNVTGTPALNSGITVNRGTSTNTFLRWSEDGDRWGWTDDGTTFYSFDNVRSGLVTTNTTFATINTTTATMNTATTNRVLKAGDTMTGNLIVSGATINTATANITTIITGNNLTLSTGTSSNGNIIFSANGAEDMRIDANGRVLIGTTSILLGQSNFVFQVLGNASSGARTALIGGPDSATSPGGTGPLLNLFNSNGTVGNYTKLALGGSSTTEAVSINSENIDHANNFGNMVFVTRGSTGYAERMRISSIGDVGIGTTSPAARLHVNAGATDEIVRINSSSNPYYGIYRNGSFSAYFQAASDGMYLINRDNTPTIFGTNNAERMRLDAAGRLLIGQTTNPFSYYLVVNTTSGSNNNAAVFTNNTDADLAVRLTGGVSLVSPSTGTLAFGTSSTERARITSGGEFYLGTTNGNNSSNYTILEIRGKAGLFGGMIQFTSADGTQAALNFLDVNGLALGTNQSYPVRLFTSATERVRIGSDGAFLVRTTTNPTGAWNGNSIANINGGLQLTHPAGTGRWRALSWSGDGADGNLYFPGGTSLSTVSNVAWLDVAGVWVNASDARQKTNIREIHHGLASVLQTLPRAYNRNETENNFVGFVAQELKQVIPEVVRGSDETSYGIDYGSLVAVAFKAIQELKAELDALKENN